MINIHACRSCLTRTRSSFSSCVTFMAHLLIPPQDRRDIESEREEEGEEKQRRHTWEMNGPAAGYAAGRRWCWRSVELSGASMFPILHLNTYIAHACVRQHHLQNVYIAVRDVFLSGRKCTNDSSTWMETASIDYAFENTSSSLAFFKSPDGILLVSSASSITIYHLIVWSEQH